MAGYEVDARLEEATRAKEREWRAKGYPPGLIAKALTLAREWTAGLVTSALYRGMPEEHRVAVLSSLYPVGLEAADRWITRMAAGLR